jgi:hypothetical protein
VPINFLSSFEKNHRKLSFAFISERTRKCLKGWEMDPLSSFIQLILTACNNTIKEPPSTKHGTFGAGKVKIS